MSLSAIIYQETGCHLCLKAQEQEIEGSSKEESLGAKSGVRAAFRKLGDNSLCLILVHGELFVSCPLSQRSVAFELRTSQPILACATC